MEYLPECVYRLTTFKRKLSDDEKAGKLEATQAPSLPDKVSIRKKRTITNEENKPTNTDKNTKKNNLVSCANYVANGNYKNFFRVSGMISEGSHNWAWTTHYCISQSF